jgi:hypothetical protein
MLNRHTLPMVKIAVAAILLALPATRALALGECGLACCLAGAATSGVTLAQNFGLAMQYEHSNMETIRHGTDEVSPDEVINQFWSPGGMYMVPTKMTMEKLSLIGARPLNARWQLVGVVPYVRNDMDMRMKNSMGMVMNTSMDTIEGIGDVTVLAMYTAQTDAPVRPTKRVTLGFGLKTPTGENDARTASGNFVHAMMQAGTGSWDPIITANYMRAFYPLVLQVNGFYHLTTESDEGYEFGDQIGVDVITRYQVSSYVNLGVDLNAIHAEQDDDHDGNYSRVAVSMVDNPANTGLNSVFITPALQFKIPDSAGSVELKYQLPIYQNVHGYQQVVDDRFMATLAWSF